ncbi:MAG: hypothetical protein JOS17DRAFT_340823 [Linnemannia elongata]|nr:MAG: hypothetical protein JOS17DRAFT_340823 [Linnemannia elongata]
MTELRNRKKDISSCSVVTSLPELVNLIGQHLSPSDLVACVQVCRLWNQTFLPLVWHTINPKKIVSQPDNLEQWVRTSFVNNCHLVRNLTVDWDIVLETAAGRCRNLMSLTVNTVAHILPKPFCSSSPSSSPSSSSVAGSPTANGQPPLSTPPELPWIFNLDNNDHEAYRKRHEMEWFWQLVFQNPGLVRLQFPQTTSINDLSQAFILEGLSRVKNLRELNTRGMGLDLSTALDVLPRLELLQCSPWRGNFTISNDHSNLRQLRYFKVVQVSMFIEVLKHLPRLESLEFTRITAEENPPTSTYEIFCETVSTSGVKFSQIRELKVIVMRQLEERYVMVMLGLFPKLRRLWLPQISRDVRKVMWEKCYWLEEIDNRRDGVVDEWKERRAKDAAASNQWK